MNRVLLLISFLSFLFIFTDARSQNNISFGDTIVHQTFGSGVANPGPELNPGEINLTYDSRSPTSSNTCPGDGSYTIANFTTGCFSKHWQTTADHTSGDSLGYFLLVNASLPGQYFFVDTVKGLCDGQSAYQFSAWLMNMQISNSKNPPNLAFSISYNDSNNVSHDTSFNTGDIPFSNPESWNQYLYTFAKPAGVTQLVLQILDNAKSGGGNDFGLDDITFCAAGPSITDSINAHLTNTLSVCKESLLTLSSTLSDNTYYTPPVYQWEKSVDGGITWFRDTLAGANKASFSFLPDAVGNFRYRMSVQQLGTAKCGVYSPVFNVSVFQAVKVALADTSVCESYSWNGTTYTKSGIDSFHSFTTIGCDSLTVQKLTIKHATKSSIDTTVCQTYTWPLDGKTYKKSGSYVYDIIGANSVGCDSIVTLNLALDVTPVASVISGPSTDTLASGQVITLTNSSDKGIWSNTFASVTTVIGSGNTATVKGVSPGVDTIKYTIKNTCPVSATATFPIVVIASDVFIPNLFSPNADNHNDVFYVRGSFSLYKNVQLWVFSSWGNLVFEKKGDIDNSIYGWDGTYNGKAQPTGNYIYVAKLTSQNGTTITKKGSITLIR